MIIKKRYKPFYKQFLRLKKNIQDRPKLFNFKKQKWKKFQHFSKNQLKFYKRFKIRDQFQFSILKFASKGNSFQRRFRNNLHERKLFSLFYGGLRKKYIKNAINQNKHTDFKVQDFRYNILKFFESRLDVVLYRANFSLSVRGTTQLILHGHILVNGVVVKNKSYELQTNDLIEVAWNVKSRLLVQKSLDRSNFWPIPPKHLLINYRTLQVLFSYNGSSNLMPTFNHYVNFDSIITNIRQH